MVVQAVAPSSHQFKVELVMLLVAGVDLIAVAGRDGGGGRRHSSRRENLVVMLVRAVSSEVDDVVVIGTVLVVEVEVVGCAPMDQVPRTH